MGDQRQADAIAGTPAALGIPLQHWILPVWRGLLKTSHSMLSTLNSRSDRAFQPPLPASWVTRAVWMPVQCTSFFTPFQLNFMLAGMVSQHETLFTCLFSVTYPGTERKSKLIFMLILLFTTPVQNWTLTFPLPLLFCLPSLTGKSCSRGSLWFMTVCVCPAAVAALPHSMVFGFFWRCI